ncbi:glycoside hydrolase [Niastella koreensis]|uniref:Beta-galactosidase n=2 Tax=Niastella koreensis TaxID=354356 RepID=G8TNJ8_NIAKG|nr:malectin domain-containing carbohydrate-binding protein [Niastella koreensis]AEV99915.1 Beta-galactosidase [Niastella koreensis GR20-10]OQP51476.1 glycoside hydrolase [Niastella koreensis]
MIKNILVLFSLLCALQALAQRSDVLLNSNWQSIANDTNRHAFDGFENPAFNTVSWQAVTVPHNWDAYEGYRRLLHGNRHGYAWYRRTFTVARKENGKRYFLWFEGVGSFATVWVNGKKAGEHAGGRTTFTIDITDLLVDNNKPNLLAVRADHPANIQTLPWVCGGCSDERGFSEGSQPMGIFRPVHLITTNAIRVEPFGVHIWNDTTVSERSAQLNLATTVKNYSNKPVTITISQRLLNRAKQVMVTAMANSTLQPGAVAETPQQLPIIKTPHLWSLSDPYCYTLVTEVLQNGKVTDVTETPYGIRWISWPIGRSGPSKQFFLNGKPVFITGIAEYEHLMGGGHAFSDAEVTARVQQIKAVGFNAFRDAHQPHNLRYQHLLDSLGLLWWTQLSAHIWYNTPEFKNNFKTLLKEWVIERRNSPSLVLWGLQNESKIPEDFAKECTQLIRELDPTTSAQRKVTTCNGGEGTDWDVPQNWTGTYGGNPSAYASDVIRQQLIGEYGAWRTLDLHTEGGFVQNGALSEDRMTQLMETKVRLAESVKDSTCGQFFWIYTSHDNPGRVQSGEGFRELDRIGPVNYKGLLTPWEEPLDAFYMYRSNYAPKETSPMVYIVSHTWPGRWTTPGIKDGIVVYSNCDEVELFNDVNNASLGRHKRNGIGTHFQWDGVDIKYNVLYAVGYVKGKRVASDVIVLQYLPTAPGFQGLYTSLPSTQGMLPMLVAPVKDNNYLYRVNCGGPDYQDSHGNIWLADREKKSNDTWGSVSWTKQFPGMPAFYASQRQFYDPIAGTSDWPLLQTFRYGLQQLRYEFPVPDGDYHVELYFIEPWWCKGGLNAKGWRQFDVAINNKTVIKNLDIWSKVGNRALRQEVDVHVTGGQLTISFPNIAAGQAVISAIAISTKDKQAKAAAPSPALISKLEIKDSEPAKKIKAQTWLNTGDKQFINSDVAFTALPPTLYGAEWIQMPEAGQSALSSFIVTADADVFIAVDSSLQRPEWLKDYEDTKATCQNTKPTTFKLYRKRFTANSTVAIDAGEASVSREVANLPPDRSGGPGGGLYSVFALPVTTLQPPFDQKATTSYKMDQAVTTGEGVSRQTINKRESVVFTRPAGGQADVAINTGVGDVYSITFRYYNPSTEIRKATWQLIQADGTVLKTEPMEFTNTREGKWNYFTTTSGSMINAGKYTIRITATDAEGVAIGGIDVQ